MKLVKGIALVGLGVLIGWLFHIDLSGCTGDPSKGEQLYKIIEQKDDSLRIERKRNGESTATIGAYELTNAKYLQEIEETTTRLRNLQRVVKKMKKPETVIVHETETVYRDTGSVTIIRDTVNNKIEYPIFAAKQGQWISANVEIYETTSDWELRLNNKFVYSVDKKKLGIFGTRGDEFTVSATNENPYTHTNELSSLVARSKPRRIHLGIHAGLDITGQPTIGASVMYSLISFK